MYADVAGYIPILTLFSGVGAAVLVWFLAKADGGISAWRKNRRIRKESSIVVITGRLEKLESEYTSLNEAVRSTIQFIQGTPDPFLKLPDGTPVVTGGLLEFMRRIEDRLPALKDPR